MVIWGESLQSGKFEYNKQHAKQDSAFFGSVIKSN